jgi:hypothetical protein
MTAVGTKLYIFGGGDGTHYLNDLHILDTGAHQIAFSNVTRPYLQFPCRSKQFRILMLDRDDVLESGIRSGHESGAAFQAHCNPNRESTVRHWRWR